MPGYEGIIEPGYEGISSEVRGYYCLGTRVLLPGYEGIMSGYRCISAGV